MAPYLFKHSYIGAFEKELQENVLKLRGVIHGIISERREEIKSPQFQGGCDFMTILLQDEYLKD